MKRATREWVEKAESDYRLAVQIMAGSEPFHGQVCFLCQQAAEKYLKAVLEEVGTFVEKTHDLTKLRTALLPHYPKLPSLQRGLDLLNRFAVDVRYPGTRATKRQALAALRWAGKVREACRGLLGL